MWPRSHHSTKDTEEQIWTSIELGRDGEALPRDPTAAASDETALLDEGEADLDGDASEEEVIQMEPVAEAGPIEAADGEAAQRLRSISGAGASAATAEEGSPGPAPAAPKARRARAKRRIFYRVSKRTSTVAFLERIFENELDERLPHHPRAVPPFASLASPPLGPTSPS